MLPSKPRGTCIGGFLAEPCNHLFSVFSHLFQKLTPPHRPFSPAWENPMGSMKCDLVLFVFGHFANLGQLCVELPSSRKGLKPAICPSMNNNNKLK